MDKKIFTKTHFSDIEVDEKEIFPHKEVIRDLLFELFAEEPEILQEHFPIIKWKMPEKIPGIFSVIILAHQRPNVGHFIYDMLSRWLIPNQRLNIEFFYVVDFKCHEITDEQLTITHTTIRLNKEMEYEEILKNQKVLQTEIRLGVLSDYHANRIMEFKGLSPDRKTLMIQEKIGSLIRNRSEEFGRSIFSQMQHFLVTCREDFKSQRDPHHISRLISVLYFVRKTIKQQMEGGKEKRQIILKFFKTQLHHGSVSKPVLGILVGMNLLSDHEVFGKTHLLQALCNYIPNIRAIENSFFVDRNNRSGIQTLYLEIEKKDFSQFSHEEISHLRSCLPDFLSNHIERLIHPVFMPRNEEETVRNIMTLSRQLKYVHDIPQVIITFDQQMHFDLSFTVIIVRMLRGGCQPIKEILSSSKSKITFILDRIKKVGVLRQKYPKEATVFHVVFPSQSFLRPDHTIDLHKARLFVLSELTSILGEIRDYNGGMILKQNEVYHSLKKILKETGKENEWLLEKFFYSITPIEMTVIRNDESLKNLFFMLIHAIHREKDRIAKRNDWLFKSEQKAVYVVIPIHDANKKKRLISTMEEVHFLSSEFISFELDVNDITYIGYILFCSDSIRQKSFLKRIQEALDF